MWDMLAMLGVDWNFHVQLKTESNDIWKQLLQLSALSNWSSEGMQTLSSLFSQYPKRQKLHFPA